MDKPLLAPFVQGSLDGFCGLYAVVNAVHYLCGPLSALDATALMSACARQIEPRRTLLERLEYGTVITELGEVLGHVVAPRYPIARSMPFQRSTNLLFDTYWSEIETFLKRRDRLVLIAISGVHDHWTLVQRATPRTLIMFDSGGLRHLSRRYAGFDGSGARHLFYPSHTYFLRRKDR